MTRRHSMASGKAITATSRLQQDYLRLKKDPVPYIVAEPLPSNICQWHYVVRGPEGTPYEGGFYHGKLVFPRQFPFKPPSIYMITPNGRFKTNTRLCLSISDFHPDTWNPAWSVSTILTGLLSFMVEVTPTFGSIETPDAVKQQLARKSLEFNLQDPTFCELFPDVVADIEREVSKRKSRRDDRERDDCAVGDDRNGSMMRGRVQVGGNAAQSTLYSAITNVCVLIGFAAFVYSVKYVMRSLG